MGNTMWIYLGIDPGKKGAIAYKTPGHYADVIDMPDTEIGIKEYLAQAIDGARLSRVLCCIESQQSWGTGDKLQGKRLTSYLKHYGGLLAILKLLGIRYTEVPANEWHGNLLGPIEKGGTKKAAIAYAAKCVPELKDELRAITKGRADAVCLALYAERWGRLMEGLCQR